MKELEQIKSQLIDGGFKEDSLLVKVIENVFNKKQKKIEQLEKKNKTYSLDQVKDKVVGKKGSLERKIYEQELELHIEIKEILRKASVEVDIQGHGKHTALFETDFERVAIEIVKYVLLSNEH